jgi:hypothetical protein
MAFNKENFYQEGNSQEFFFTRTNPLANPANAEILKIEKSGCCGTELPLVAEYGYNGMAQTFEIDFSSPTSTIDSRYVKVVVTDGQGNFATAVGTGTVGDLSVDVSNLDVSVTWTVSVVIEVNENAAVNCPCIVEYTFPYLSFAGTVTVDTTTLYAARIALFEADGTTPVADGGAYDLGTFPDGGTTEDFRVVIANNGASVLTISSVSFTGDVLSFTLPQYAGVVYPGGTITLSGKVDASGIAGSYTGTITINSDAVNDPFTIDIDYTLA